MYKLYDDIDSVEEEIEEVETRIYNVRQQKISGDNTINFFCILINCMISSRMLKRKSFLTASLNELIYTSKSSRMAVS